MKKKFLNLSISLISLSFFLAACTPPIPPDVLASYAEAEVTCANGAVNVLATDVTSAPIQASIDLYLASCPEANVTISNEIENPNIVITDFTDKEPTKCVDANVQVPIMHKTSALAYFVSGFDGLYFNADVASEILSGKITNLNDPKIAETNPNFELIDQPLTVLGVNNLAASDQRYLEWLTRVTGNPIESVTASTSFDTYADLVATFSQTEGAIALLPSNIIFENTLTFSNLFIEDKEYLFDSASFASAASQFVSNSDSDLMEINLDPTITPAQDAGLETTSNPWQGISTVYAELCGSDDSQQSARIFLRFLLRLDAQGQLEIYGYFPIAESLRLKAAGIVGKTLPTPSIDPALLQ
ncbi:MAG: hypothetical protein RJA80_279 [Actinomycetota bacterium]